MNKTDADPDSGLVTSYLVLVGQQNESTVVYSASITALPNTSGEAPNTNITLVFSDQPCVIGLNSTAMWQHDDPQSSIVVSPSSTLLWCMNMNVVVNCVVSGRYAGGCERAR